MSFEVIYMFLKNEGADVWVPVQAEPVKRQYRIIGPMPEDQEWEFSPGSIVSVKPKVFADGKQGLVAVHPDSLATKALMWIRRLLSSFT